MMANATIIVKRHPNGYAFVPFDHDEHPHRPEIVKQMIAHLVQTGHTVEHREGVPAHSDRPAAELGSHVILRSGPLIDRR